MHLARVRVTPGAHLLHPLAVQSDGGREVRQQVTGVPPGHTGGRRAGAGVDLAQARHAAVRVRDCLFHAVLHSYVALTAAYRLKHRPLLCT